jgi:nitrite reductase/ring-hydroxylating ferredoxin subunit
LNIVGKSSDIAIGETKLFSENDPYGRGARYLITRTNSGLVAYDNTCTHEGCGIETILPKNQLRCNCHGAEFNAITGAATKRPAYDPLRPVLVSEVNGEILIG